MSIQEDGAQEGNRGTHVVQGQGVQVGSGNIMVNTYLPAPPPHDIREAIASLAPGSGKGTCPLTRVPRTVHEERILLATAPPGWEYMYYAASIYRRCQPILPRWREHQLKYSPRTGEWFDRDAARRVLTTLSQEMLGIINNIMVSLKPEVLEMAFGRPGEPGNDALIDQAAGYLIDAATQLLDYSAQLRGAAVPRGYARAFELAADTGTTPLTDVFNFVDRLIAESDRIPQYWGEGVVKPLDVTLVLELTVDKKLMKEFSREVARAMRR